MKKIFLAICLFVAVAVNDLFAQNIETNYPFYIEVTGKAEKEVAPDQIYMDIVINEKDYKNKSLVQIEKELIQTLNGIGIDTKKDLTIADMASNFKSYFLKKTDVKVTKEYQLIVHNAPTAGKVVVELQNIGIANVNITKLENSKIEQYKKDIKIEAIKSAKEKAIMLSAAIDQSIGKAIYILEQEGYSRPIYYSNSRMMLASESMDMATGSYEAPQIEFETIKIETSVLVRFELW